MSASTAAELLDAVKAAKAWKGADVAIEYGTNESHSFPVSMLDSLLTEVSLTSKAKAMVGMVPPCLRAGGADPHKAWCELETYVQRTFANDPLGLEKVLAALAEEAGFVLVQE